MSARPPLELAVELTDASGRVTRWDGNARSAGSIPSGISFGTKRGDGFADGPSIDLNRRIDRDWCADEATEILTAEGWKSYDDVEVDDLALTLDPETRAIQWLPISAVNVFPGSHQMIRWTGTTFDALTTLNHRWLADTSGLRGGHWSLKPSRPDWHFTTTGDVEDFYRKRLIIGGGQYVGSSRTHDDDHVELAGWYVTEGSPEPTGGVRIGQSRTANLAKVEEIRALGRRMVAKGAFFSERDRHRDVGCFYFGKGAGDVVKGLCPDKALTPELLCSLTATQALALLKTLMAGDGSVHKTNGTRTFYQQDLGRCDAFQMLCAMLGIRTKLRMRPGTGHSTKPCGAITLYKGKVLDTHEILREPVQHDGIAWCPTTPTGTWMARRNGVTYWTGNSDINLFDDVRLIGADGSIAYEGYISANPRSFDGGHTTSIRVAGPMTLAQQRPFSEVYVDRDLSNWIAPSNARQAALLVAGASPTSPSTQQDAGGASAVVTAFTGSWDAAAVEAWSEAIYYAPDGVTLGYLYYQWQTPLTLSTDPNFSWIATLGKDDVFSAADSTADLSAVGPGVGTLTATTTDRTVAQVQLSYASGSGTVGVDGQLYSVYWQNMAPIGNHGLSFRDSTTPGIGGLLVSDMIIDICRRFVPKLDPSGVQTTDYPVDHAVFQQSQPYDAWLALNKYHLWELAVWENNELFYYPADTTDYDWQIRLDDPGVTVDLPGDSTETLANGIVVTYLDVQTGLTQVLDPTNTAVLSDPNPLNLATLHGETIWTTLDLSAIPLSAADAAQTGAAALAEFNQAKAAGTITFIGHIRDRAGHWQPGWKVRASDTIAIVNHPDDRPRLIGETTWDQDSKTGTIAVDNTLNRVDAFLDRTTTALKAAGLSTYPT